MRSEQSSNSVIVVTDYTLHQKSNAAFSRMHCYKKAIGEDSEFLILELNSFSRANKNPEYQRCEESSILFTQSSGKVDGYLYRNLFRIFDFLKPLRIFLYILKKYHRNNTTIVLYSSHLMLFLSVLMLKFFCRYKVIVEKNELEISVQLNLSIPRNITVIPFWIIYPIRIIFACFIDLFAFFGNDIIVISTNLQRLYRFHPRVHLIPILVDIQRFNQKANQVTNPDSLFHFVYLGTITKKKDAIFSILDAIQNMKKLLQGKANFTFIGAGSKRIMQKISTFIEDNKLEDLVNIKPQIQSREIPLQLSKYNFALLLRESNLQTRYGFSTKLGEYLAAGLPVIINDISDNAMYLKGGIDSIFIKKASPQSIMETLEEILNLNPDELNAMQRASINTAENCFDYKIYMNHLMKVLV